MEYLCTTEVSGGSVGPAITLSPAVDPAGSAVNSAGRPEDFGLTTMYSELGIGTVAPFHFLLCHASPVCLRDSLLFCNFRPSPDEECDREFVPDHRVGIPIPGRLDSEDEFNGSYTRSEIEGHGEFTGVSA